VLPFVESFQRTVGVGEPDAAALNEAVEPTETVSLAGCKVIFGATALPRPDKLPGLACSPVDSTVCRGKPTTRFVSMRRVEPR
jgi:hypothetical protein